MRQRIGPIQLEAIRLSLSDRDTAILRTIASYRLVTGDQTRRLHFTDHATPNAAARATRHGLHRLFQLGAIDHLERRIGGVRSGSQGFIWHLASVGRRLLATTDDNGRTLARIAVTEPSLRTVDHTLAITDTAVRLHELAKTGAVDLIESTPEPSSWRTYLSHGGGRMTLKPDLFAILADTEYEYAYFIEIDRGTESPNIIVRKAQQYQTYRATGIEQQATGVFPRILWITPDAQRAERISQAIASAGQVDAALHTAITSENLHTIIEGRNS